MPSNDRPRARRRLVLAALALAAVIAIPTALAAVDSSGAPTETGRLLTRHSDDFTRGRSTEELVVQLGNRMVPVRASKAAASPLLGKQVRVRVGLDGTAELVSADGESSGSADASLEAPGAKRVAVLLINFSNDTRQPWTTAQVRATAFDNATSSVAEYHRVSTWGRITLTGDVFGWFTLPETNTSCNYTQWATSANKLALAAGIDTNQYDNVVYAFPSTSACGWSGLAYLPGRYSWLNNAGTSLRVMAHELGHNYGTHHSATLSCTENGVRVPLIASTSSCSMSEYGDPFSVMGAAQRYVHTNVGLGNMGVLQSANTQTVTASGDYLLRPIEPNEPSSVQALRVRRTTSSYLVLEFRQPDGTYFGHTSTEAVVNGVSVRIAGEYTNRTQTQLVDTTPTTTSFVDAPLGAGRTLTDPLTGVTITTLSVGPAGALVRVSFGGGGTPDTTPPGQPGSFTATALDASRIALSWSASTDNVGVAGYRVYRGGTLVASPTGTSYTDTGLAASTTYGYTVVAYDAAGNTSTAASASATTQAAPTADTEAPTAPSALTASAAKKKVSLGWGASSDNVGVAGYRIYRDGVQVAATASTSWSETVGGKTATVRYHVVAFDAAGNTSAASNSVTVTT